MERLDSGYSQYSDGRDVLSSSDLPTQITSDRGNPIYPNPYDGAANLNARNTTTKLPLKSKNPFVLPPAAELFGYEQERVKQVQAEKERLRTMTLVERTNTIKTPLPPLVSTATHRKQTERSVSQSSTSDIPEGKTKKAHAERCQRMTEFILEKRQIFLVELIIDRKKIQIQKLEQKIQQEEQGYVDSLQEMEQLSMKFKTASSQADSELVKARKRAEAATHTRVELSKELKRATLSTGLMKNEINKNEELLETYQLYHTFLTNVTPKDQTPEEFFNLHPESEVESQNNSQSARSQRSGVSTHSMNTKTSQSSVQTPQIQSQDLDSRQKLKNENAEKSENASTFSDQTSTQNCPNPAQLMTQMSEIEQESLFLVNACTRFDYLATMKEGALTQQIRKTNKAIQKTKENIPPTEEFPEYLFTKGSQNTYKKAENELIMLQELIHQTFFNCFGKETQIPTISILELIENSLEEEFHAVAQLDQTYVRNAQAIRDKEHREEDRKLKQLKQEEDQQRKMEQAIERANKPIKKRKGRPIVARSVLRRVDHHDDEKLQKIVAEKKKEEKLLYGHWSQ